MIVGMSINIVLPQPELRAQSLPQTNHALKTPDAATSKARI